MASNMNLNNQQHLPTAQRPEQNPSNTSPAPRNMASAIPQQQHVSHINGTKRNVDTLFVGDNDESSKAADSSRKRIRTSHNRDREDDILAKLSIDEDGRVAPYNAFREEGHLRLGIYHSSFNEAEKMSSEICQEFLKMADQLKAAGYRNEEVEHICAKLRKKFVYVKERYPSVSPTACLGPSGVGKSSTINSILHQTGAAHESDSAHRGTNLVHEFSSQSMHETALFQVAAPYLRESQIEKLANRHCANIFQFLGLTEGEDMDETEIDDLQRKFDTGIDFFRILLCDHKDFMSQKMAEMFFEQRTRAGVDIEDTIKELTGYIEDFKCTRGLRDNVEYHTAENNKELANIFRKVSRVPPSATSKPHPWPILTKIEVRHDNPLLNAGNVIGDTPGMDDINQSVVDNTTNYIQHAGLVLVFTKFERGAINEVLDTNLLQCIKIGKAQDVHLIVTMIDGRKVKADEREDLSEADLAALEAAEERVQELKKEERQCKQQRFMAMQDRNFDRIQQAEQALNVYPIKIALAETHVEQVMVQIKTRVMANEVKDKLRRLDRSRTAPDLPIHFVSNSQYQKHLAGYDAVKPPALDPEGTGIPAIRRLLYEVPARGKVTTLSRIGKKQLPNIFDSIIGVLTKSRLDRKTEVSKVIVHVLDKHEDLVDRLMDSIKKRRDGKWRRKKGERDITWNGLLQEILKDKVAGAFGAFEDDLDTMGSLATTNVNQLFKDLETMLDECADFQGVTGSKQFIKAIRSIRDNVLHHLEETFKSLIEETQTIRRLCIIDRESYFNQQMASTYKRCSEVSAATVFANAQPPAANTGRRRFHKKNAVHPHRVEVLREKLTGSGDQPSIFESVCNEMSTSFAEKLSKWETEQLFPALKGGQNKVIREFDQRFVVEDEVKQEGTEEAIKKLKDAAFTALEKIEGPLKEHIKAFEEYEETGMA